MRFSESRFGSLCVFSTVIACIYISVCFSHLFFFLFHLHLLLHLQVSISIRSSISIHVVIYPIGDGFTYVRMWVAAFLYIHIT